MDDCIRYFEAFWVVYTPMLISMLLQFVVSSPFISLYNDSLMDIFSYYPLCYKPEEVCCLRLGIIVASAKDRDKGGMQCPA